MARPHECAELLLNGYTPREISKSFGINIKSVKQYLYIAIGMGLIRRSDILLSIDKTTREKIEQAVKQLKTNNIYTVQKRTYKNGSYIHPEDLEFYLELREDGALIGDLYVYITDIEKTFHGLIKMILQKHYGAEEEDWWRKGIPEAVRIDCVKSREQDDTLLDQYCYTTFVHLKQIIEQKWSIFKEHLPLEESSNKKSLIQTFDRLNNIRNKVMHPVKQSTPTYDEFEFVREVHKKLDKKMWRKIS